MSFLLLYSIDPPIAAILKKKKEGKGGTDISHSCDRVQSTYFTASIIIMFYLGISDC